MTTYKTSELEGALLDAAVAKAEGVQTVLRPARFGDDDVVVDQPATEHEFDPEGPANEFSTSEWKMWRHYRPSADWALAGPILERERIALIPGAPDTGNWGAHLGGPLGAEILWAPTPLEAACRAFVASKLGETVELP